MSRLARHLVPPAGEDLTVVQGTIVSWNPATFGNIVNIDGQSFDDIPVASGVEALTYVPGDVVLVEKWFPGGHKGELGLGTPWIRGRVITPGAGAAERAVAFLRTTLAEQLAAEVFAARIHSHAVAAQVNHNNTNYGDLDGSPGPTVTVPISETGVAIVTISSRIRCIAPTGTGGINGFVSVQVTGATSVSPDDERSLSLQNTNNNSSGVNTTKSVRASMRFPITGLNPGEHTFTMKYRTTGGTATFEDRSIIVEGL